MNKATTATLSGVLFACVLAIPYYAAESQGDLAGKRIDLTEAAKTNATFAVILGQELADGNVVVKNMESGKQVELPQNQLLQHISK